MNEPRLNLAAVGDSVNTHRLDVAVVGNGRTAALVDPGARMVWWCFPRFDSDPIFCRLIAGDEEKGFADVRAGPAGRLPVRYLRNTAIVTTVLTDRRRRRGEDHRLRAALLRNFEPHASAAAADAHHRAHGGAAARHHPLRPTQFYGKPIKRAGGRQPITLWRARHWCG